MSIVLEEYHLHDCCDLHLAGESSLIAPDNRNAGGLKGAEPWKKICYVKLKKVRGPIFLIYCFDSNWLFCQVHHNL